MNGTSALIKGTSERSSALSTCEHTMGSQQFAAQKWAFTRTRPHWHPALRLAASRTVRNRRAVDEPPRL